MFQNVDGTGLVNWQNLLEVKYRRLVPRNVSIVYCNLQLGIDSHTRSYDDNLYICIVRHHLSNFRLVLPSRCTQKDVVMCAPQAAEARRFSSGVTRIDFVVRSLDETMGRLARTPLPSLAGISFFQVINGNALTDGQGRFNNSLHGKSLFGTRFLAIQP